jgi:hypothetical protein
MLERNFYCEIHLLPETRRYYTVVTSAAHYLLTFTIVSVLYTAIYIRLKSRSEIEPKFRNINTESCNVEKGN